MPYDTCKGIIINENISTDSFKTGLEGKLVSNEAVNLPRIRFGIPEEYFHASEILKKFLNKERNLCEVVRAYTELSTYKIKFLHKNIKERFEEMLQVIILKGIYYLSMFSKFPSKVSKDSFEELATAIDKLLGCLGHGS